MRKMITIFFLIIGISLQLNAQSVYLTHHGHVTFASDAPLEFITAQSYELSGAIDLSNNHFAFKILNRSLKGFNSPLQQEHFYENYMETDKYPYSTFQGKIIEVVDKNVKVKQSVRAKGILSIHGVDKERIINADIEFVNDSVVIISKFDIPLEDHNIRVPSIVYQKIAENIAVEVHATLLPEK